MPGTPIRRLGALGHRAASALESIEHLGTQELSAQAVVEQVVHRIAQVVEVDAFYAGATDPDTGLSLGAGTVYDYDHAVCNPFWEHEFLIPDFNKFADMSPDVPAADLRQATGGRLQRSARYRTLNEISDLEDELRAVFYAGGRQWGAMQLNRRTGGRPFTEADVDFVRRVAPLAGTALRRALLEEPAGTDPGRGPGVVLVGEDGTVLDVTGEADAWLQELASGWRKPGSGLLVHPELLTMALSTLGSETGRSRRVRLRTPNGTWLVAHASALGGSGTVALVLELAKASEILPIVVEAYALTPREVEVTRLVARGLSTPEIAGTLFLSPHTVRDHLKAIFEKVGVSSRSELTARLFAEHYHPAFEEAVDASWDRTAERMSTLAPPLAS
jgi:DNA-binding CsgD family transcriptional regulator